MILKLTSKILETLGNQTMKKLFKSDHQESRYSQISEVAKVILQKVESRITLATLTTVSENFLRARTNGSAP